MFVAARSHLSHCTADAFTTLVYIVSSFQRSLIWRKLLQVCDTGFKSVELILSVVAIL